MKVWKIVSGVLSIVISLFVVFQSFFAGAYNVLTGNGQSSGTAGVLVAIMLLTGGIVAIATHNGSRGGDIAMIFLYSIGAFIGFLGAGSYKDLYIWAAWCALCVVLAVVDCITLGRRYDNSNARVPVSVQSTAPARSGPVTFQDVILEPDPRRRDAAIDALPERQAKNYLKQALNVLVPRYASRSSDDDDGLVKILIAILVVVGCLVVGVIVIGALTSTSNGRGTANSVPPAVSEDIQESESAQSETAEPTIAPSAGAGALGDYYVEIQSAFIADDYEGNPAIIIMYSWTNNSDQTTNAATTFSEKAFQNGVQIDRAVVYSSDTPGYDSGSSIRDVRPGATTEVQCAFILRDMTSTVEFEISELFSFSDDVVSMDFTPSDLNVVE